MLENALAITMSLFGLILVRDDVKYKKVDIRVLYVFLILLGILTASLFQNYILVFIIFSSILLCNADCSVLICLIGLVLVANLDVCTQFILCGISIFTSSIYIFTNCKKIPMMPILVLPILLIVNSYLYARH